MTSRPTPPVPSTLRLASPGSSVHVSPSRTIPVLLLKTRSQPDDTYEELFNRSSATSSPTVSTGDPTPASTDTDTDTHGYKYAPHFIPVLEHTQNGESLGRLGRMLRSGELKRKYGGMIFTSQRAVEAWTDVVGRVEDEAEVDNDTTTANSQQASNDVDDAFSDIDSLTPFPLYVVGPATERALSSLMSSSRSRHNSPFTSLNPSIHGSHTGNGATLATFIQRHYNSLHAQHWFTYYEAPRLPFIPLLGMSSQNYGRKRLEGDDVRLVKKPLVFLVGEVRRDVIPRVLGGGDGVSRIEVEEVEVYSTVVMRGFEEEFRGVCEGLERSGIVVVVVFSPQGSEAMLKGIGYLDGKGRVTGKAKRRWWEGAEDDGGGGRENGQQIKWVVVTIGPSTREYLRDKLGVEPDASAEKPSPEGLKEAIEGFLREKWTQGS